MMQRVRDTDNLVRTHSNQRQTTSQYNLNINDSELRIRGDEFKMDTLQRDADD